MRPPRPVFVHGSGGGPWSWRAVERRFEGALTVALPGHPDGAALDSVDMLARWLAADLVGVPGPVVLVGHSLGGAVALAASLLDPDLAVGLVLVTTGARLPVPDDAMRRCTEDHAAECERLARSARVLQDPAAIEEAARRYASCGPESLLADYRACAGFDARGALPDADLPTLVVAASEDPLTPPWLAQELADGLPRAHLVEVVGAGHAVPEEDPEAISLLVAGFLALLEVEDVPFPAS